MGDVPAGVVRLVQAVIPRGGGVDCLPSQTQIQTPPCALRVCKQLPQPPSYRVPTRFTHTPGGGSRLRPPSLRLLRLLLELLRLALLLSRDDALVLGLDLLPVAGHLVALLGPGPEVAHGEAVVEVGPKEVHDANREHDIRAELGRSARPCPVSGGEVLTLNTSRLSPPMSVFCLLDGWIGL